MATNVYTAAYTLDSVKRRGLIPGTGKLTSATDLLAFVNDAVAEYIVPLLMAAREGYLHATEHTAFTGDGDYAMPRRAASERLVRVALVATTTDTADLEYPLARIETNRRENGQEGFELTDNVITIREAPTGYSYLRIVYFQVPNRLVALAECAKITGKTATTVSIDAAPSTFTTSEPLDFVSGTPGFRCRAIDKTPTIVAASLLTFASGVIPSTLAVGDYVALAGETPIVQIPVTLRPLVEQKALCLALASLNDQTRLGAAQKILADMEKRLVPTLSPRVAGAPRVITTSAARGRTLPVVFR